MTDWHRCLTAGDMLPASSMSTYIGRRDGHEERLTMKST